jgi:integral membrane sensor domain MASE1
MSSAPHTSVASGAPIVADAPAGLAVDRLFPAFRYALWVLLLAAGYYGAGQASLALQYTGPVAAIWLPVGVGVAALYLGGLRFWPGVLIGDLALADSAQPLGSALGLTLGNMADVLVITLLLRRLLGRRGALDRLERVGGMLVAIAAGAAITATVAMVSLRAGGVIGSSDVPTFWRSWFFADASGSLVVVPLALAWAQPGSLQWSRRDIWQGALLIAVVIALSAIALSGDLALTYMVFPALIGAALRFGQRGATLAVAVAAGMTVWLTANEMGAFVSHSITDSALSTQLYLAVAALTTLCLAAIVDERRRGALDLAASERRAGQRAAEERHRIARDLHDSVSQSLFSARLHLRTAERALTSEGMDAAGSGGQELARAQQLTAAALAEMRALVYELRPDGLGRRRARRRAHEARDGGQRLRGRRDRRAWAGGAAAAQLRGGGAALPPLPGGDRQRDQARRSDRGGHRRRRRRRHGRHPGSRRRMRLRSRRPERRRLRRAIDADTRGRGRRAARDHERPRSRHGGARRGAGARTGTALRRPSLTNPDSRAAT